MLTELLFSVEPKPCTHNSVLTGGLVLHETLWRGCLTFRWRGDAHAEYAFVFPPYKPIEDWPAGPFVFVDPNKRPYVLTRLKDRESGTWEYTRYRAEANSVIYYDCETMLDWIPAPIEGEYQQPEDDVIAETKVAAAEPAPKEHEQPEGSQFNGERRLATEPTSEIVTSFGDAIEAIRRGHFESAIPYLEMLVRQRPNYHVGWLRLGFAQRERAARLTIDRREESLQLLGSAVDSFTNALGHVDQDYRASAFYERSKAQYRRYVISGQDESAQAALNDADEACVLSSDSQFQSWLDYLYRQLPRSIVSAK
jgi:hypothetical protein